jgi:hypothetical protein
LQKIDIINGGYRYYSSPIINVSSPLSGVKARAVGVITSKMGLLSSQSLSEIYIEDPGYGYTSNRPPIVTFYGGGGYNAQASVGISSNGIGPISLTYQGQGYVTEPTVTISGPVSGGTTAVAKAFLDGSGGISTIRIINSGYGYTEVPTVTISTGTTVSSGNFVFNEPVIGSISNASAFVKHWDADTQQLKVTGFSTHFVVGDIITGEQSNAIYVVSKTDIFNNSTNYEQSEQIQEESDKILEFNEINPFGEV